MIRWFSFSLFSLIWLNSVVVNLEKFFFLQFWLLLCQFAASMPVCAHLTYNLFFQVTEDMCYLPFTKNFQVVLDYSVLHPTITWDSWLNQTPTGEKKISSISSIVHLQNKHHLVIPSGRSLNLVHSPYIAANLWSFFLIIMYSFPGGFPSEQ